MSVYVLWPDSLPTDVMKCTAQLAAYARKGRITGIAFVAYVDGAGFIANAAGDALTDAVTTRGMVASLSDKLAGRVTGNVL